MPLVKASEAIPERPVVIGYYGDPGTRKTSISHTAEKSLLLDFDRGVARSFGRKDTLVVDSWDEVLKYEQEGLYKNYKTIIIDTAKAALDDFLMAYVIKSDYQMQKNKLKAYGAIGDAFKLFLNSRRLEGCDVVIIAHAKKDEDRKKLIPDVTGQSYQLMLRVCDMLGFTSTKNNQATIQWYPTDETVGKNTANLPDMPIPDKGDPAFKTFLADIISKTKEAMVSMTEEQTRVMEEMNEFQAQIAGDHSPDSLTELLIKVNALPDAGSAAALKKVIGTRAKELGFVGNKETKRFEAAAGSDKPSGDKPTGNENAYPEAEPAKTEPPAETKYDDRVKALTDAGVQMGSDGFTVSTVFYSYEDLESLSEKDYQILLKLALEKKSKKKNAGRTAAAA